ncbi:hypothetical protein NYP83_10025 [Erwinia pyrifoliae]|uniref:hypothetical protein n=1 Tax=Erwinia pyrifoliae TaxID=79967 RepID=UPI0021D7C1BD|nr:hypothetical protein [Erwinia pyrifoliae]MCU8587229.1 hypothetical protein [Erwinia pyrifoliae]
MLNTNEKVNCQATPSPHADTNINLEYHAPDGKPSPLTDLFETANNSTQAFSTSAGRRPYINAVRAVWKAVECWRPWTVNNACSESMETQEVLLQGKRLYLEAKEASRSLCDKEGIEPPPFSLKGKVGLALGAAAALTGAGLYFCKGTRDKRDDCSLQGGRAAGAVTAPVPFSTRLQRPSLPYNKVIKGTRHVRRHLAERQTASAPKKGLVDDVKPESLKKCYKPYGLLKMPVLQRVPCGLLNKRRPTLRKKVTTRHQSSKTTISSQSLSETTTLSTTRFHQTSDSTFNMSKPYPPRGSGRNIMPVDKRKFFISPDLDSRDLTGADPVTITPTKNGHISIEQLFDFSCVDKRKDLSWADIIRQIGLTLGSPLKLLLEESQIVHHHNTLRQGCPTDSERQHLSNITGQIDAGLTQIMSFLPGSQPVVVLQLIVGPALEVFADQLEGKPTDVQKTNELNTQLLVMARQTIPTLSANELTHLYNKQTYGYCYCLL